MTAAELKPDLRKLIDARLDAIDRILVRSAISWTERRNIVSEVETQIFELLARRGQIPTQEDVLAVLDSLDPPESYLPEELRNSNVEPKVEPSSQNWSQLPGRTVRLAGKVGGVAVCVAVLVVANVTVIVIMVTSEGVIPWLVTLAGLAWLNYAGLRRFKAWSATRQGSLIEDLRHAVAEWLMPKNRAPAT